MFSASNIPEGRIGDWAIEKFIVGETEASLSRIRDYTRAVRPGQYTKLTHHGSTVMSDTSAEYSDHIEAIRRAEGICLVTGLGLGLVANEMAKKEEVDLVIVIEKNQEVIDLIVPHIHERIVVIKADALEWRLPRGGSMSIEILGRKRRNGTLISVWPHRFDVVWHDIWPNICLDSIPERTKLRRKYGRRCWWQDCWAQKEIDRHRRKS